MCKYSVTYQFINIYSSERFFFDDEFGQLKKIDE